MRRYAFDLLGLVHKFVHIAAWEKSQALQTSLAALPDVPLMILYTQDIW